MSAIKGPPRRQQKCSRAWRYPTSRWRRMWTPLTTRLRSWRVLRRSQQQRKRSAPPENEARRQTTTETVTGTTIVMIQKGSGGTDTGRDRGPDRDRQAEDGGRIDSETMTISDSRLAKNSTMHRCFTRFTMAMLQA